MTSTAKPPSSRHRSQGPLSASVVCLSSVAAVFIVVLVVSPGTITGAIPTVATLSSFHRSAANLVAAGEGLHEAAETDKRAVWVNGSSAGGGSSVMRDTSFTGPRNDASPRTKVVFQRAFKECPSVPSFEDEVAQSLRLQAVDSDGQVVAQMTNESSAINVLVGPLSMQIPLGLAKELVCASSAGAYSARKIAMPGSLSFPISDLLDTRVKFAPPLIGVLLVGPPQLYGTWSDIVVPLSSILRHMSNGDLRLLSGVYLPFLPGDLTAQGAASLFAPQEYLEGPTFLLTKILGHEPQVGRSVSAVSCFCRTIVVNQHRPLLAERRAASQWARERIQRELNINAQVRNDRKRQQRPRLLLITRLKSRILGNATQVQSLAELAGFDVTRVFLEHNTYRQRALLASTTDVIVGVHGQGLTWSAMMDGVVVRLAPNATNGEQHTGTHRCRSVVELRHFGRKLEGVNNIYQGLARDNWHHYESLFPAEVEFGNKVSHPMRARDELLKLAVPYGHVAFDDQTVFYNARRLLEVFRRCISRLKTCFGHLEFH